MKLYDAIVRDTLDAARSAGMRRLPDAAPWPDTSASELILQRDAAFELGGSGQPSVNYTLVSSQAFLEEGVYLAGRDLGQLKSDSPFARVVLLTVGDLGDDEAAHDAIRKMEYVRYHVFPRGYMVRVSSTSFEEQVRIGKEAVKQGISFVRVGQTYLAKYREVPGVCAVSVLFLTEEALIRQLKPFAKKTDDITKTLTHILDGLPTDCGHCKLKPVCDEVEGMREMHLGKKKG